MAAGKPDDALAFGDKALASMPTAVDILVSQVDVAQQAKKYGKVMDYATRGAKIISGLPAEDKKSYQNNYEYLEAAGYNAIMSENDPQARLSYVEPFEGAFPNSRFETAVTQQAFASLQQMGDPARTYAFGEHVLQGNPNSVPTLITLADAYAEDVKTTNLPKAITYAKKAIELTKPEAPDADQSRRVLGGFAYSVLGYALLKQDKAALAVSDLKSAVALLKEDPSQQQIALYRLGFAYAKLNKLPEAKEALTQAVAIDGPMKDASKDLLSKVSAARPKPK